MEKLIKSTGGIESQVLIYETYVETYTTIRKERQINTNSLFPSNGKVVLLDTLANYEGIGKVDVLKREDRTETVNHETINRVVHSVKRYTPDRKRVSDLGFLIDDFPLDKFAALLHEPNVDCTILEFIEQNFAVIELNKGLLSGKLSSTWERDKSTILELSKCQTYIKSCALSHPLLERFDPEIWECSLELDFSTENILFDLYGGPKFTDCFLLRLTRKIRVDSF